MASEIKVDTIKDIASTNIVNKCGTTINIGAPGDTTKLAANTIRSNALQNACGGNTISKCATTVTIGQSGDTVNLASGASQSGFGRTGTVDWDTGSIKTTGFTAVSGNGYFCNTTSGVLQLIYQPVQVRETLSRSRITQEPQEVINLQLVEMVLTLKVLQVMEHSV